MDNISIKILLVDDDAEYASIIKFWLDAQGYTTFYLESGQEALEVIKKGDFPPSVVFLDINMPGMDGIEVLKQIREINTEIPVIMVTAYGSESQHEEAIKLGIAGFFNKSSDFMEAAKLIKNALETIKEK